MQRGIIVCIINACERRPQSRRSQPLVRGEDDAWWSLYWTISAYIVAVPHTLFVLHTEGCPGSRHNCRGRLYGGISGGEANVAKQKYAFSCLTPNTTLITAEIKESIRTYKQLH